MTQLSTRTIDVAGQALAIPQATHRRIQQLLDKGNKIDAIVAVRKLAKVQLKPAKAAVEDPGNFDQPQGASVDRAARVDAIAELRKLVTGEVKPRQWMALHPQMAGGFGASLIVLSLMIATAVAWDSPTYSRHQGAWYFDLETRELFSRRYAGSPAEGIDGKTDGAVRAYVFACGSCRGESFIGFIERFDENAAVMQQKLRDGETIEDEAAMLHTLTSGHKIAQPGVNDWAPFDSDKGRELRRSVIDRCDGQRPAACLP